MSAGELACLTTPKQHNPIPPGAQYACDNGRYGKGWPGYLKWWAWLDRTIRTNGSDNCLFACAPDIVGDALGTLAASLPWLGPIRSLGIPVAFVAQDGCEGLVPWRDFDVLFIGGTTEFKLASGALCAEALSHGKTVHVGRVNSAKRMRLAAVFGAASCDGTFLTFGPDTNLPRLRRWFETLPSTTPSTAGTPWSNCS